MKNWLLLLLLLPLPALAQSTAPIQDYCNLGGTKALTSGLKSTNYQQGIIPSCTVAVYVHGWQTPTSSAYQSGGSVTGTTGQNCSVTFPAGSPSAGGLVALTGTNTIAGGTPISITSWGNYGSAPTTATLGNGSATCSGTAVVTSVLGPSPATLFKDGSNTPLANPFTANTAMSTAPGQWIFWANALLGYDVVLSGGIAPNTYPSPVTLIDVSPSGLGNYLPLAGGTLYGELFAPNINGEVYPASCGDSSPPSWCSGSTADAWYRAACTQLPASGGVINLLGLTGTIAGPMACSTPTKQVITLQDPTSLLTVTEADGGTVFPLDSGSMFVGQAGGSPGNCPTPNGIHLASSANITAIVGPVHTDGTQESVIASGLCLFGATGATVSQGLLYANHVFANSIFEGNVVGECSTACAKILNTGEMNLVNNWFNVEDGNTSLAGTALIIQGLGLGNGCNVGPVNVWGGQVEHSLGGAPEIDIKGDGTGLVLACDIHIHDLGIERSPGGTASTNGISIADCKNCSVENVLATGVSSGAQSMIKIAGNLSTSVANVVLRNISNIFGTFTNTLNDTTTFGIALPFANQPFITTYYSSPGYVVPPVLPLTTLQAQGSDAMSGAGNFSTGSGTIGTGFVDTGCNAGVTCTYTRTSSTAPPGLSFSQEIQITANTDASAGFNGVQYGTTTPVSFTAGQAYVGSFWAKSDGTFVGFPSFLLWNSLVPTFFCDNQGTASLTSTWTAYAFTCTPTTSGSSNLAIAAATPAGNTGTFWLAGFSFAPVQALTPGSLLSTVGPYGIGPATTGQQTITINSVSCELGGSCTTGVTAGTPTAGQAACIKAAGPPVVIGYCSTVVGSTGACTCN